MNKAIKKFLSENGVKGGNARAKSLTAKRRKEIARMAGLAPKRKRLPQNKGIDKNTIHSV